jgi:hypothetical protein
MDDIPKPHERVRLERMKLLKFGPIIAIGIGLLTFCGVVPILALLNLIRPHLPWIPADRPIELPIATAWKCAKFATIMMLCVEVFLFSFAGRITRRKTHPSKNARNSD